MCESCQADAAMIKEDVIPGFHLFQSQKGTSHWPKGHYGLVIVDGPFLTWEGLPPHQDPLFRVKEEDETFEDDPIWDYTMEFQHFCEGVLNQFRMGPRTGYEFTVACIQIGYSPATDGNVVYWFFGHLAKTLNLPKPWENKE